MFCVWDFAEDEGATAWDGVGCVGVSACVFAGAEAADAAGEAGEDNSVGCSVILQLLMKSKAFKRRFAPLDTKFVS